MILEFEQEEDPSARSFFSEIISSISDVRFSHDGRYILSRDYLTVKIWDVNMERQPIKTIPIHEHLRPRLCDTYENDSIFDKFEVVFSGDAKNVMTGSYNNNFMIYPSDPDKEVEVVLQADKSAFKAKKVGVPTPINMAGAGGSPNGKKGGSRAGSPAAGGAAAGQRMRKETDADQIDFNKKILHMSWHPFEDSIAIAATNNVSTARQTRGGRLCANLSSAFRFLGIVDCITIGKTCQGTRWRCLTMRLPSDYYKTTKPSSYAEYLSRSNPNTSLDRDGNEIDGRWNYMRDD